MVELREKLGTLDAEREAIECELAGFEDQEQRVRELELRSSLVEWYLRDLSEEELEEKRRAAEDAKDERFRAMYDDFVFRMVAHPDGSLEVTWKNGAASLGNSSLQTCRKRERQFLQNGGGCTTAARPRISRNVRL